MKIGALRLKLHEREKLLWLCSFTILVAGYLVLTHRYEQQIGLSIQRTQALYEMTVRNRRLVAQSGQARVVRLELETSLRGVLLSRRSSDSTPMLLRDIDALARQSQIYVTAVAPEVRPKESVPKLGSARGEASDTLHNEAIDISVRGQFRDLLRFIARIPRQHVLLRVSQATFGISGVTEADSSKPILDGKIHILVYRLALPTLAKEEL